MEIQYSIRCKVGAIEMELRRKKLTGTSATYELFITRHGIDTVLVLQEHEVKMVRKLLMKAEDISTPY